MSVLTFIAYGWDKRRASLGQWRIKEHTLHLFELLGGWPGALVAQRVFHHKWHKTPYMIAFWAIVVLHLAAWIFWFTR
jgi:uncharacterized membrane protein YsdA (DUF1294 family)